MEFVLLDQGNSEVGGSLLNLVLQAQMLGGHPNILLPTKMNGLAPLAPLSLCLPVLTLMPDLNPFCCS